MKRSIPFTLFLVILGASAFVSVLSQDDLIYISVDPCRIADTREAGGVITANNFRNFRVSGTLGELAVQGGKTDCLDPKAGTGQKPLAISAYVIAVPTSGSGNGVITAYPSDQSPPPVGAGSTVNFAAGQVIGNTTNITLCDQAGSCPSDGEFAILARNTDQHVVIDVQGYFYPMEGGSIYVKSNGENIGLSVGTSYDSSLGTEPWTYTVFNNKGYMFEVTVEGVIEIAANLRFESSNCTGQAYFRVGNTGPVGTGTVFRRRDTLEASYILKGTQPVLIQEGSFLTSQGDCTITFNEWHMVPILPNDPTVTEVQNSYATPITLGF